MKKRKHHKKPSGGFFESLFGERAIGEFLAYMLLNENDETDTEDDEWRIFAEDGTEFGLSPYDFESQYEYECALEEKKSEAAHWSNHLTEYQRTVMEAHAIDPKIYASLDAFEQELTRCLSWRDDISPEMLEKAAFYALDPQDYILEDDFLSDYELEYDWKDFLLDEEKGLAEILLLNIDAYEDEDAFHSALETEKRQNPRRYFLAKMASELGIAYEVFECEVEKYQRFGLDPLKFKSGRLYCQAISEVRKDAERLKDIAENGENLLRRKNAQKLYDIQYGEGMCFSSEKIRKAEIERLTAFLSQPAVAVSRDRDFCVLHCNEEHETIIKSALYEKFGDEYPQLFLKQWKKQTFYEIGNKCTKNKLTYFAPIDMLSYLLQSGICIAGYGVLELLSPYGSEAYNQAIYHHKDSLVDIVEKTQYTEEDCNHLCRFIGEVFFSAADRMGAGFEVIEALEKVLAPAVLKTDIQECVKDMLTAIVEQEVTVVDEDVLLQIKTVCTKYGMEEWSKYKKAAARMQFTLEANSLLSAMNLAECIDLGCYKDGKTLFSDVVSENIGTKKRIPWFTLLDSLLVRTDLTHRQKQWLLFSTEALANCCAEGYATEEAYQFLLCDSALRRVMLREGKKYALLWGLMTFMAVKQNDIAAFCEFWNLYKTNCHQNERDRATYFKTLAIEMENFSVPYKSSIEQLQERMNFIQTAETMFLPLELKYKRPFMEYQRDVRELLDQRLREKEAKERQKKEKRTLAAAKARLSKLIQQARDGNAWKRRDKDFPETVLVDFVFPNGKHGDIDMFIASEYGTVTQKGDILYCVEISTEHVEQIVLMAESYVDRKIPNEKDALNINKTSQVQFLSKYNHYFALDEAIDEGLENGMDYDDPLRKCASELLRNYRAEIRNRRNAIYADLSANGSTTSKWKSEQQAYAIVKNLFPDAIYQYKTQWLGQQSLDVYIPSLSVGIEYQGVQHYQAISVFGGQEGLAHRLVLDKRKRELCECNGVKLVEWRYDEPLTSEWILSKIETV